MVPWAGPLGPTHFLSEFLPDMIKSMGTPNVSNYRSWVLCLSRLVLQRGTHPFRPACWTASHQ